jgi:glycogen(starch) synthase
MRIAYLTQEFTPLIGGIGSYVLEAARTMTGLGHDVEVFTVHNQADKTETMEGFLLHRLHFNGDAEHMRQRFADECLLRHRHHRFDLIESPEYLAQALEIRRRLKDLPLVVKLHTSSMLTGELNNLRPPRIARLRYRFGCWRRGQACDSPWWHYQPQRDPERALTRDADLVVSPSRSLLKITARRWGLRKQSLQWIPNPYVPAASLLEIPPRRGGARITYFGRLEGRKGVLDLAAALPEVLRRCPHATVRFVGAVMPSDEPGVDMRQRMERYLRGWEKRVEFLDPIPRERLHELLAESDICVFPSLWENFPNACLEAMAAAQAIVASRAGGMAEMLDGGRCGLLVPPRRPRAITAALLRLIGNSAWQIELGHAARDRVLGHYGPHVIGPQMESSYRSVINAA